MITGKNLVAGNWEHSESSAVFQTVNPKTKTALGINHQETQQKLASQESKPMRLP